MKKIHLHLLQLCSFLFLVNTVSAMRIAQKPTYYNVDLFYDCSIDNKSKRITRYIADDIVLKTLTTAKNNAFGKNFTEIYIRTVVEEDDESVVFGTPHIIDLSKIEEEDKTTLKNYIEKKSGDLKTSKDHKFDTHNLDKLINENHQLQDEKKKYQDEKEKHQDEKKKHQDEKKKHQEEKEKHQEAFQKAQNTIWWLEFVVGVLCLILAIGGYQYTRITPSFSEEASIHALDNEDDLFDEKDEEDSVANFVK